jgi:hypothetical protein
MPAGSYLEVPDSGTRTEVGWVEKNLLIGYRRAVYHGKGAGLDGGPRDYLAVSSYWPPGRGLGWGVNEETGCCSSEPL